ncbi:NAD(+) kinase [Candidatus Desantisbacteria bacterium CG_4_8_14_3_um_filter_40_12]|uniref:NAD kinase n=3 Tax=unclassified Candidatus Desantisiibacteriota TaxID=3106372 RepID=A0A2M7JCK9_9BACT|nr:MAG: NAD(+) kinase [Candidatus Desantisbacteria bacterium CG23_combo_of_CG06-09_8_20_14_all_40_23]PIX17093.1 MAG: NAD(+) kinase [Candidatus Desantisbacteria bacterium CG_4_8_14_3_um_filter_40_12]PIY19749.1 MAG: NAD(+) kinase [Candidatus Desantisbacteria bacterium CG_4_10_14_3_um_filter_40_18]
MKIGLIINIKRPDVFRVAREVISFLTKNGEHRLVMDMEAATAMSYEKLGVDSIEMQRVDLILAMGGDGTLLHTVRMIEGKSIPILGINLGSLGFLTEVTEEGLYSALTNILLGHYQIEKRMMLSIKIIRQTATLTTFKALNEAVVAESEIARMVNLKVFIDAEYLTTYRADGLIISTPTGSTGYSLAAGGTIVVPRMKVLMLTPVCPHTLTARPMIIPENSKIIIEIISSGQSILTIDGQQTYSLEFADKIEIERAEEEICLIKPQQCGFYEVLRNKLKWGGGIMD